MAATYRVLILRASDGEALGEVSANDLTWTNVLTGMGSCTFTLPLGDPKGDRSLIGPALGREIAVVRDNVSVEFHGPIVSTVRSTEQVEVTAADPGYYLSRRVTEGARNYGRPVLDAVRNLVEMATGAVPGGSPKPSAGLYRLTVDGSGGPKKVWQIASSDRLPILDMIGDLADDDPGGFDYRWDYPWQPSGMVVSRSLRLRAPTIGVDRRTDVVLEPPSLTSYTDTEGLERAANRVIVLGSGEGKKQLIGTSVNAGSLNSGLPLLETVVERTNVRAQTTLNNMATQYRRLLAPSFRIVEAQYRAGALAYRTADLGDTIAVRLGGSLLDRRIVAETVSVSDEGEEQVKWTFNDPTTLAVS